MGRKRLEKEGPLQKLFLQKKTPLGTNAASNGITVGNGFQYRKSTVYQDDAPSQWVLFCSLVVKIVSSSYQECLKSFTTLRTSLSHCMAWYIIYHFLCVSTTLTCSSFSTLCLRIVFALCSYLLGYEASVSGDPSLVSPCGSILHPITCLLSNPPCFWMPGK